MIFHYIIHFYFAKKKTQTHSFRIFGNGILECVYDFQSHFRLYLWHRVWSIEFSFPVPLSHSLSTDNTNKIEWIKCEFTRLHFDEKGKNPFFCWKKIICLTISLSHLFGPHLLEVVFLFSHVCLNRWVFSVIIDELRLKWVKTYSKIPTTKNGREKRWINRIEIVPNEWIYAGCFIICHWQYGGKRIEHCVHYMNAEERDGERVRERRTSVWSMWN